jgi:GGDEF domain-containing protein
MLQKRFIDNSSNPQKKIFDKIGRTFCLVFNRVTMYEINHPYTVQAVKEFFNTISEGLRDSSPIVLIMNQEQFFVEDEPFDSRLNTTRMVAYFKKCAIESLSFETGVTEAELGFFFRIFCDQQNFPKVDAMKEKIAALGVNKVKINYVFFKKMNSDEKLILKKDLSEIKQGERATNRDEIYKEVLDRITEGIVLEEFEQSISLKNLLEDPEKISRQLIEKDLSVYQDSDVLSGSPGEVINQQLVRLKEEIGKFEQGQGGTNLSELADAVFEMKAKLLAGIEEQKALGFIYKNEKQIKGEVDEISDRVIVQLVKDEYKKGSVSVQRLGHIIRRLIPDHSELQRLLPKLKEAMLSEGMSASAFVDLLKEIGEELQNEELSEFLKRGAEKIGLDSDELIRELKIDPEGAAELIYLASEIRNGTGDEKVLTELLVDYIERVGSKFADEFPDANKENEGSLLRDVLINLGSKLVNKLKVKNLNNDVLIAVEKRLGDRMEKFLSNLETNLKSSEHPDPINEDFGKTTVFRMLEESVDEGDELQKILTQVRKGIENKSIDENNFQQIHDEILKIKNKQIKRKSNKALPKGVLNYINTILYIEKEIFRSLRYDTPFSTITFSVIELKPQKPVPSGSISGKDISQSIMGELINLLRGADIVGILNKDLIVVLLPMTNEKNARIALQRIRKSLHEGPIYINEIPILVRFAGAVASCDHETTPDLQAYLSLAENNHRDLVVRLKNINDLM